MKFSMSITKGLGNQKHNNRTQKETTKNVNHDLTFLNVTLLDENIRSVYNELFSSSVEKYNAKQTRDDRKINDYYSKIAGSKKEKTFHELVVSIGNIDNAIRGDIANEIYTEFLKRFINTNPQMRVFGAYIHHDEIGTVHMHLDYIPFSIGNKRGMEKRIGNNRAIEQMGYRNWADWKDRQFETLEKICQGHGIERVSMDNHSRHMSVESYKKEQRMIENLQNSLEHTLKTQNLPVIEQIRTARKHNHKKENSPIRRIFSPSGARQRAKRQNKHA